MATSSNPSSTPLGILAAFAGIYIVWGTTYLAIAVAIQTVPPFISGAARFIIAAALMYVWLRSRNSRPLAGVNVLLATFCGVLLSGIGNGLVVWAQQGIPSGIAALIVAAVPVVVLIIDWASFSKRPPRKRALIGIAIALVGVATIVLHTRTLAGNAQPLHLLALIAAVIGWSFGTLLQKRGASAQTVLSFTCVQMFAGGLFQLAMSVVDGEWQHFDPRGISLVSGLAIAHLILFGSLIGLNCYLWLLTRVSAQKVTTYALVNPVVALILGALLLGERVTPLAALSAALVLLGVGLVLFQQLDVRAWWRARRGIQSTVT